MQEEFISRTVPHKTDETLLEAIGNQHSVESALADLIDNSIEHGASEVAIQLITSDKHLVRIRVQDDGEGMSPDVLEEAMNLRKKKYAKESLSYFGTGMKMASMSQAGVLRVLTKNEERQVSGAQLRKKSAGGSNVTEILREDFALAQYEAFSRERPGSGTVIELLQLEDVSVARKESDRVKWLNGLSTKISLHLGLVFHRFLESGQVRLFIEQWVEQTEEVGGRKVVLPIDPFSFSSPRNGYPANFALRTRGKNRVELKCYIVPPNSESDSVKIHGKSVDNWSGFFVYRHNRLLQAGGWQELVTNPKEYQLARIKLEITDELLNDGFRISSEKVGVKFGDEIKKLIPLARSNQLNLTFEEYLSDTAELRKSASKRSQERQPMTPITGDENHVISQAIRDLIGFKANAEPLEITSVSLNDDQVFELDIENKTLRINSDLFNEGGPLDSEPAYEFFKATLYFLLEGHFTRTSINKATQAKIEQMHRVLASALGIQAIYQEAESSQVIPTPSLLAEIKSPTRPERRKKEEEQPEFFRPVWSSGNVKKIQKEARDSSENGGDSRVDEKSSPEMLQTPPLETRTDSNQVLPAAVRDPDLARLCLQAIKEHRRTYDVASVAEAINRNTDEVVALLVPALIGYTGNLNNSEEAYLADEPLNASDKSKVISRYSDGADLVRISQENGRTVMQIARVILDSPKLQLRPSAEILKRLRQAAR